MSASDKRALNANQHDIKKDKQPTANWYAKLHPIGKEQPKAPKHEKRRKLLNLSLFFRIWIAVSVIIVISGIVVFNQLFNYVRPVTQQVIEDTLVDTSKLLSASLQSAVATGRIYDEDYQSMLDSAFSAPNLPDKEGRYVSKSQLETLGTWYYRKTHSSFRVYVTDAKGKVIYDSLPIVEDTSESQDFSNAEGKDYSRWRDVYLTLKGEYGARTTSKDSEDDFSSVMYVAQPIYAANSNNQKIIGVVSVGKPTNTILPYLNSTRQRMLTASLIISLAMLIMAGLIAWWLKQSMMLVTRYTHSLAQDTKKPYFYLARELNELTETIEDMKHRLENRAYVTDYVHTLTHELKSPLTAIRASGELLEESDLDNEDRLMLSQTITEQSIKLQSLIDRLLLLAKIEQPTFKLSMQPINPDALLRTLINGCESQRQYQQVNISYYCNVTDTDNLTLFADKFWLMQALQNVLDNALYFAHSKVIIILANKTIDKTEYINIRIFNDGELIPEYALDKIFDRYFSLSHQYTKALNTNVLDGNALTSEVEQPDYNSHKQKSPQAKKGTGLGLTLVKQVIERHGGTITIANISDRNDIENSDSKLPFAAEQQLQSGVLVNILLPVYFQQQA